MIKLSDVLRVSRVVLGKDLAVCKNAIACQMDESFSKKPHLSSDKCSLAPLPSALRSKNRGGKQQSQSAQ
jgi:hypothetical protein